MKRTITLFRLSIALGLCGMAQTATAQTNHVVISQVFGGGGTSASVYDNDFVELYNPTSTAQDVAGWSVQYSLGTSTTYVVIPLTGTIPAKSYFLVGLGRNTTATGMPLPTPDVSNTSLNIGSVNLKIALMNNTASLSGNGNPAAISVDFVGIGTVNHYESSAASAGSNGTSLLRKFIASSTATTLAAGGSEATKGNAYDTETNSVDFVTQASMLARNSGIAVLPLNFTGITVGRQADIVLLQWTVANELAINHYVVEQSVDGRSFEPVGVVRVSGNQRYEWTGKGVTTTTYYRVRSIEATSGSRYSATVKLTAEATMNVVLYPNPVNSGPVTVQLMNQAAGAYTILVHTATGQSIYTNRAQHTGGTTAFVLPSNMFSVKGNYVVSVTGNNQQVSFPLIKE